MPRPRRRGRELEQRRRATVRAAAGVFVRQGFAGRLIDDGADDGRLVGEVHRMGRGFSEHATPEDSPRPPETLALSLPGLALAWLHEWMLGGAPTVSTSHRSWRCS